MQFKLVAGGGSGKRRDRRKSRSRAGAGAEKADYRQLASVAKLYVHMALLILLLILLAGITVFSLRFEYF